MGWLKQDYMKLEMRKKLARESFEEKIRKVGQLIQFGEDDSRQGSCARFTIAGVG